MNISIKSRWDGRILFEGEFGSLKLCVEAAVKARANLARANLAGADLTDADLTDANLTDANLAGANLARANLAGADLTDADLTDANLADAYLARANLTDADLTDADLADANLAGADLADAKVAPAAPEEVERLDAVREIVLANPKRLAMNSWHSDTWTPEHTPEEEHKCGSAHCIAGWLQALSPDPAIRKMDPLEAGRKLAPCAAPLFFTTDAIALRWLEDRGYAPKADA